MTYSQGKLVEQKKFLILLGVAAIFLVLVAVLVEQFVSLGSEQTFILVAAAIIGGYMALNIGANDVANNMGPAVGGKVLTVTAAVVVAVTWIVISDALFEITFSYLDLRWASIIKFLSEIGMRDLLLKTENLYMQENSKNMHVVTDPLYFIIEEKQNSVELTDKGIDVMTGNSEDKDFFIMESPKNKLSCIYSLL